MSHVSREVRRRWREMTGRNDWRPWFERRRKSRVLNAALVLVVLGALAFIVGCTPRATVRPAKVDQPPAMVKVSCEAGPWPKRGTFATTRAGCPAHETCFDDANMTALLDELGARRLFDERVAACVAPDEPPNPARVAPAP